MVRSKEAFDLPTVHPLNWTKGWHLQFYASQPGVNDPQLVRMWGFWATALLPLHAKDFVQKVLWRKRAVHECIQKCSGMDMCPICGQNEDIKNATVVCRMFWVVLAVVRHYYLPITVDGGQLPVSDVVESTNQE